MFEKIVGEPMDVVVGNRLMARGENSCGEWALWCAHQWGHSSWRKNRRTTRVKSNARTLRPPVFSPLPHAVLLKFLIRQNLFTKITDTAFVSCLLSFQVKWSLDQVSSDSFPYLACNLVRINFPRTSTGWQKNPFSISLILSANLVSPQFLRVWTWSWWTYPL